MATWSVWVIDRCHVDDAALARQLGGSAGDVEVWLAALAAIDPHLVEPERSEPEAHAPSSPLRREANRAASDGTGSAFGAT